MSKIIKPYKSTFPHAYACSDYATYELLKHRPRQALEVYIHPNYHKIADLERICTAHAVPALVNETAFARINQRENCYVLGVFEKFSAPLRAGQNHVLLVRPSDPGNLGTIMRIVAGLGIDNLGLIDPLCDPFHPKAIRASMGAVFAIELEVFSSMEEYIEKHPAYECYCFMLGGSASLHEIKRVFEHRPYTLVFGNEAKGLPKGYHEYGQSVRIPQTKRVDSLNLSVAVGIGAYAFSCLKQE